MTDNIFEKAAHLLTARGHCKGRLTDTEGRLCAAGAIHSVSPHPALIHYATDASQIIPSDEATLAVDKAGARLMERGFQPADPEWGGLPGAALIDWNDREETTAEDVILLFKELAQEVTTE